MSCKAGGRGTIAFETVAGTLPLLPDHRMLDFRALWKESPCGIILRLHRRRGSRMYRGTAARYLRLYRTRFLGHTFALRGLT